LQIVFNVGISFTKGMSRDNVIDVVSFSPTQLARIAVTVQNLQTKFAPCVG
jgi:hypothetical protein